MNSRRFPLLIGIALLFGTSACARLVTNGEYTLPAGETLRGDLVMTSGSITLEENSTVTGSVLMTSGSLNLEAGAEIEGSVLHSSAKEIVLGPDASIGGSVVGTSGEITKDETATVAGRGAQTVVGAASRWAALYCLIPIIAVVTVLFSALYALRSGARRNSGRKVAAEQQTDSQAVIRQLRELKEMKESDLISEKEYEAKKADVLGRM